MPSTFSQSLRLELIGTGEQANVWGVTTNNNLGTLLEQSISGNTPLDVGSGNITLTALNGVTDQARSAVLTVTGAPGTTRVVTIPNVRKSYTVRNRSDSTVQIKTSGGVAFDVPSLSEAYLYCDGNDDVSGRYITDGAQSSVLATQTPYDDVALTGVPTAPTASFGTSTTQLATTAFVQTALQAIYPIGSVYINADSETSPATLLGFGSWTAIGEGQVLVGQNAADADFDILAKTGGSKNAVVVSHTHTATIDPASVEHTHSGTTGNENQNHTHSGSTSNPGNFISGSVGVDTGASSGVFSFGTGPFSVSNGNSKYVDSGGTAAGTRYMQFNMSAGSHSHSFTTGGISVNHQHEFTTGNMSANATHNHTATVSTEGESGTGKNLQPYVVVKMWKRVS